MGIIFSIGWTLCVSLRLGSILGLAANTATLQEGVYFLLTYALGMGLPFVVMRLGLNQASCFLVWLKPHVRTIEVASGGMLIVIRVLIFFNLLLYLNSFFTPLLVR